MGTPTLALAIRRAGLLMLFALCASVPAWAQPSTDCPPQGSSAASLRALKAERFAMPAEAARQAFALALQPCLASPDAELRDGIAFEAYSTWMRAGQLSVPTLRTLSLQLQTRLADSTPDAEGFAKPFAALVLAEVARTDRIAAWMTPAERQAMVDSAGRYMQSIRDYRGLDAQQGWRHGVAHTADWMMQLALNPAVGKDQLDQLLQALGSQLVAHHGHAYVYAEPERLAAPVLHMARRKLHSAAEWQAWLAQFAAMPAGMKPDAVYRSPQALAQRHNLLAFLQALYFRLAEGADEDLKQRLKPAVAEALKRLP